MLPPNPALPTRVTPVRAAPGEPCCATCAHFRSSPPNPQDLKAAVPGFCYRYPPQMLVLAPLVALRGAVAQMPVIQPTVPQVLPEMFCGEYLLSLRYPGPKANRT